MHVLFLDDSRQRPESGGRQRFNAIGGIICPENELKRLETRVGGIKRQFHFPEGEEIKWSPDRDSWVRENLVGERRTQCWRLVLNAAQDCQCQTIVSIIDTELTTISGERVIQQNLEHILERFQFCLHSDDLLGIVIADRLNRGEDDRMIGDTYEFYTSGTSYVQLNNLFCHVLTTTSHTVAQIQVADLVTGVTCAMAAGQTHYAAPLFPIIEEMFYRDQRGRIRGCGLKLFPSEFRERYCVLNEQDEPEDYPW